jgi:hypothetical protein
MQRKEVIDRESISAFMLSLNTMLSVKQIKLEKLADKEMERQITNTCGSFHKASMAYVWKIRRMPSGDYSMSRQLVNKYMARKWIVARLQKQQSLGLSLNIKWRTELCTMFFTTGKCTNAVCSFAHSLDDLQEVMHHVNYRKEKCVPFHEYGDCKYGHHCRFLHRRNDEPFLNVSFTAREFIASAMLDI